MTMPSLEMIRAAAKRIAPYVHKTDLMRSSTIDAECGAELIFKCENLQKVGAFKARGATNAVFKLQPDAAKRGVITHSSGNHGAALAYAASCREVPCVVVMPDDAPTIKKEAVAGYGALIVECARAEREATCQHELEQRGMTMIHPYEHPDVIEGQATASLELLDEAGELDLIVAPVGGGGLLSGTASTVAALCADRTTVWGAEPAAVDDAYRSLESGELQPAVERPNSWGDGLLTGLGCNAFTILRDCGVRVVTVSESEMLQAAWTLISRLKTVVEPSAATVLAAAISRRQEWAGKRIGLILSGGNTDFRWLAELD